MLYSSPVLVAFILYTSLCSSRGSILGPDPGTCPSPPAPEGWDKDITQNNQHHSQCQHTLHHLDYSPFNPTRPLTIMHCGYSPVVLDLYCLLVLEALLYLSLSSPPRPRRVGIKTSEPSTHHITLGVIIGNSVGIIYLVNIILLSARWLYILAVS